MRFAIQHGIGDPRWTVDVLAPQALTRWCKSAESNGWDAIGFTDHPAPTAPWIESGGEGVADPFGSLGFCAAVTERVRLLTFVLVPSYRSPFLAAHQLATLDRLSNGRLTIGLGTGYLFGEILALGGQPQQRLESFDRSLATMLKLWAGEEVTEIDESYSARRVRGLPPVLQSPHPPLWIHGNSRFGLLRAARDADGWLGMMTWGSPELARTARTRPIDDLEDLRRRIEALRAAAEASGRSPGAPEVVVAGAWSMLDVRRAAPAETYLETIDSLRQMGVDCTVSLCCGDDPGAAEETLAWFGQEVIRSSRSASGT